LTPNFYRDFISRDVYSNFVKYAGKLSYLLISGKVYRKCLKKPKGYKEGVNRKTNIQW
jgi:hypothetical protein